MNISKIGERKILLRKSLCQLVKSLTNSRFRFKLELPNIFEIPVPTDETHPDYKERGIYLFGDSNVPVYGVPQAQSLLKTVVIEGLPDRVKKQFESVKLPSDLERSMQQSVLVSHLLDAEQQKTAKIKNPLKPMFVFPRNFGITEARKK